MAGATEDFTTAALGGVGDFQLVAGYILNGEIGGMLTDIITGIKAGDGVLHGLAERTFQGRFPNSLPSQFLQCQHAAL